MMRSMANTELLNKPRKQERWWQYATIGLLILLVASFVKDWLQMDWLTFVLTLAVIIAWVLLGMRSEKPWQYVDGIRATQKLEVELTGKPMDYTVEQCDVVEYGNRWLVYWRKLGVTYGIDPVRRVVVSRQLRKPDDIMRVTDQSRVLATAAQESIRKKATAEAMENRGIETGLVEGVNDDE